MIIETREGYINTDYIVEIVNGLMDFGWADVDHFRSIKVNPHLSPSMGYSFARLVIMSSGLKTVFTQHTLPYDQLEQFIELERSKTWKTLNQPEEEQQKSLPPEQSKN